MILTGGADPYHIAYGFLKEINASNESSRVYHIVVGKMSPDFEQIKELSNRIENVVIYHNVEDMLSLMRQCDIAVSAAGSTLYELCACGIPTINYIFADNQIMGAKRFAEDNIMFSAGDVRDNKGFFHNLSEVINVLSQSVDLRIEMSRAAQKMVDGRGALLLAKELEELFS